LKELSNAPPERNHWESSACSERAERRNKIFFSHFLISRAPQKNQVRKEENVVSAFCPNGQAEADYPALVFHHVILW